MPVLSYEIDAGLLRGIRVAAALEDISQKAWVQRELEAAVISCMQQKQTTTPAAKGEIANG